MRHVKVKLQKLERKILKSCEMKKKLVVLLINYKLFPARIFVNIIIPKYFQKVIMGNFCLKMVYGARMLVALLN